MRLASLVLTALIATVAGARADDTPVRGVVELFTSQGCSSCPPADRLANELSRDASTLVLTLPVDYWDYLGWRDTLGSPAHSARQRGYAIARGDRKVFTPQMIVNGRESAIGGDGAAVVGAVTRGQTGEDALALPVSLKVDEGRIRVAVGSQPRGQTIRHGEVWVFALDRSRTVQIGRGENKGRTVTYANVVRKMTRLGAWDDAPARFDIRVEEVGADDVDAYAVLVQTGNGGLPGPIVGAAQTDRRASAAATSLRLSQDPL